MNSFFNAMYAVLGIPFGYVLRGIFYVVNNYTISLILFTLFARILMIPTTIAQQKSSVKTQRIQPKLRRINEKYKGDNKKIQDETQALYQREGYNPMGGMGCMPLLLQLPIIYGLIGVIYHPLKFVLRIPTEVINSLTSLLQTNGKANQNLFELEVIKQIQSGNPDFVSAAGKYFEDIKNFPFDVFGISLGEVPRTADNKLVWIVPALSFLAALASGIFSMIKSKKQNPAAAGNAATMGCMALGMPLFSFFFASGFPIGIGIYWTASSLFAFITSLITSYTHSPQKLIARDMVDETVVRRSKENYLKQIKSIKDKSAEE